MCRRYLPEKAGLRVHRHQHRIVTVEDHRINLIELVISERFVGDSTALTTASTLTGIAASLEVQWLPPVLCNMSVDTFPEDLGLPFVNFDPVERIPDLDQIALEDVLKDTEEHPNANEDGPCEIEAEKNVHSVELIWTIPFVSSFSSIFIPI